MTDLLILAGVVLVYWILASLYDPWVDCWFCGGSPKKRRKGKTKVFHFCAWPTWLGGCDGSGRRRRFWSAVLGRGFGKI